MGAPTGIVAVNAEILGVSQTPPAATVRVGDSNWTLRVTLKEAGLAVDVSSMTLANSLCLIPPKGSMKARTPVFQTDGIDGVVQYVFVAGDLDSSGPWQVQVKVAIPGGVNVLTESIELNVQKNGS